MTYIPAQMNLGSVPKMPNGMHHIAGGVIYIQNGYKHRMNGPAEIKRDGYKAWYWEGLKHRNGGPAVEYPDGTKEYWTHGKFIKREKGVK